jgi:hypothetical protein
MYWIYVAQGRNIIWAVVNAVIKLRVSNERGEFLAK